MTTPTPIRFRVLLVVLIVLLAFGVVSFFADRAILGQMYARVPATEPNLLPTYDDYADDYPREAVEFELDGKTLRGYVYGPENTRGLIIFRHGIFSQHQDYLALIPILTQASLDVAQAAQQLKSVKDDLKSLSPAQAASATKVVNWNIDAIDITQAKLNETTKLVTNLVNTLKATKNL